MDYSTPDSPVLRYLSDLLKFMPIELVVPSNHLILCRPLLLLPSIFPSIRVFSNELAPRIRWPKYYVTCTAPKASQRVRLPLSSVTCIDSPSFLDFLLLSTLLPHSLTHFSGRLPNESLSPKSWSQVLRPASGEPSLRQSWWFNEQKKNNGFRNQQRLIFVGH